MTGRVEIFGPATLHLGDCLEILPGLPRPDALVMDPPYVIDTRGAGIFRKARTYLNQISEADIDKGFDHSMLSAWRADSIVVFCHNDQLSVLLPILWVEFPRQVVCFWQKSNPMPVANKHYQPDIEPYIHAWQLHAHPLGELADKKRVWTGPVGKSEFDHPTVKPLGLMQKILRNVNGDVVCDPYMGTGTTGVAALGQGRRFVGIEKNERYFDMACRRIEAASAAKAAGPSARRHEPGAAKAAEPTSTEGAASVEPAA